MVIASPQTPITFPNIDLFSFYFDRLPGHARSFPSQKPIFQSSSSPDRTYNHDQLFQLSRRFATLLKQTLAFDSGQTLALVTANDIDIAPVVLGTWYIGGVVTPANPLCTDDELKTQLLDSSTSMILTHVSMIDKILTVATELHLPHNRIILLGDAEDPQGRLKHWRSLLDHHIGPELLVSQFKIADPKKAVALLPYSSGTMGKPKGVILTHHNITSNVLQAANTHRAYFTWNGGPENTVAKVPAAALYNERTGHGGDRILAVLPIFHVYGMMLELLLPMWTGILSVICPRFDVVQFCADIKQHGITKVYIVPPIALRLWRSADIIEEHLGVGWGKSMRICFSGAAPLSKDLIDIVWTRFRWRVIQAYGLSEASPGVTQQSLTDYESGKGAVGTLLSGMEAKIVHLIGDASEVEDGEEGELVVRGPNIFNGYLNRDDLTNECLSVDGWLRTGDLCYFSNGTGNLHITGRVKELIKYNGFQIAPAELEAICLQCPIVEDVAVIGILNDEEQTEFPRAYCVRKGGLSVVQEGDEEFVLRWVETRSSKYKWLRGGVRWVDTINRSASGKILRRQLEA